MSAFTLSDLIFMMSEDINERLVDSEQDKIRLETEVSNYKTRISRENESISDAIMQINNLLDSQVEDSIFKSKDTKNYINSIFNRVSVDHPELNDALIKRLATNENYIKPTILIVDDSSIIRNSLKRIFDKEYNIITANNGNEAIDIITKNILSDNADRQNIVAILLDLIMPGSDGFVVLDFLNNFNLFSKIPVAIISGDETRETRKRVYQYDIVDMLEKPFNTDTIKTRINKIINLYLSSNNLQSLLIKQNESTGNNSIKKIIEKIVSNITNSEQSVNLKRTVQIITEKLANDYPKYGIDSKYVSAIVDGCSLYNIGAIAMSDNEVITSSSITEEINYGLSIVDYLINDSYLKKVTSNIIKYSCEMYNGSGYPEGLKGDMIPIEAQITNIAVRLCNKNKSMQTNIKSILNENALKYNKDIIEVINNTKKDLKKAIK